MQTRTDDTELIWHIWKHRIECQTREQLG